MNALPYIPLDEELSLNLAIFSKILHVLGKNKLGKPTMDIDKAKIFMYLIKNPSKIERVMILADKKPPSIETTEIYTIKSMSINVDILFSKEKIKEILINMSALGFLTVKKIEEVTFLELSESGVSFAESLAGGYYDQIYLYIDGISSLKSLNASKLYKILNNVFTEAE
ncbi:ABC-three component system middle component 4 [Erwinia pyrifoliae]|uniref:Uncharacterized protein n=1 Tax=Erwinia pyrifoliae TaxID=79967 RepID=D0UIZ9_ERWPY|nr:ABC-three component system middle component 4 [Erwinia pyrifoliae]ACY01308.1 unknown [Erwinia pyrifoliae]AUX71584.1 hypothetical protein CPI84_03205 [Erwinia pyrifoliae]MCA8878193.1 hypothetical protein [Erwinia pyrifoliae]CAX56806.1 uncharacterized protein EpC_30270 [Erwinia pyrifoliae Ep1/96]